MPLRFLDDEDSTVSSPPVVPLINNGSTAGEPKSTNSPSLKFLPEDSGRAPSAEELHGLVQEGYKPSNEDLRTIYEHEQKIPTLTKLGRGIKEGFSGVISPILKAPGEFAQDPSASRLLSSAGEGIVNAAAGTAQMAGGMSTPSLLYRQGKKALDFLTKSKAERDAQAFEDWKLNYLKSNDVGVNPLPSSTMKAWSDYANKTPAPESAMVQPYPNISSVVETAASLPMFEGLSEASGLSKIATGVPKLGLAKKALGATGESLEAAGRGLKWVGERPEAIAEGVTKRVLGPDLAEHIGGVVKLGELPAAGAAALLGEPTIATALAGAKVAEKSAGTVQGAGQFANRLAKADPVSPFGRLYEVAKDSTSPEWMRVLADHWVTKVPAAIADTASTGAKAAGIGALFGAGLSAVNGDDAEKLGQNIGGGAAFGALTAAASAPKLRKMGILQRSLADVDRFYQSHLADGISPETMKKVSTDAMTWGATMERVFGDGTKIRFADEGKGSPLPPEMHGQAGMWSPETKTIWVNVDARDPGATVLHEVLHPIFEGEVTNRPELKQQIDTALQSNGRTAYSAKVRYAMSLLREQFNKASDPAQKRAMLDQAIQARDANSQATTGDPDSWIYSEILSEAAARSLYGQHPILDVIDPSVTAQALQSVQGFLEKMGVQFKEKTSENGKPATVLPGFENVIDNPVLRKTVNSLIKAQKEFLPGKTPEVSQGVKVNKELWGKHPGATLDTLPNGQIGNDFVVQTPGGKVVERPTGQVKKIVRNRRKEVNAAYPVVGNPLPASDKTPGIAIRQTPSGLIERSGVNLGPQFDTLTTIGDRTKAVAHDLEQAIANGETRQGWYQQIGESPDWKASVQKDTGAVEAQYKEFIPINFLVDKQGNILVRNYSITALDRKANQWAQRTGPVSLELWGGDIAKFKQDVSQYLKNHSEGLPGEANNLGTDKKNLINAFLVGGNRTFEAKNPLRTLLKGENRQGVVRSYRLDRLETLEPGQSNLTKPEYQKQVMNLSPEDVGKGVIDQAQDEHNVLLPASPAEKSSKGKKEKQTVGDTTLNLVHLSTANELKTVDPGFFGKGRANRNDLSGGNKSYWFVEGSPLRQDVNVFGQGGYRAYAAEVPGTKIYDLSKNKPDPEGYFQNVNRFEADEQLKKSGYDGVLVETSDGRKVVMLFKPQTVTPAGEFKGKTAKIGRFSPSVEEKVGPSKANETVRKNAADYMETTGRAYNPNEVARSVDEKYSKTIADFYDEAQHDPSNPEVQAAYKAFGEETIAQWKFLTDHGVKMEPWIGEGQPYKSSSEMTKDVRDNQHLWFFPTEGGFGTSKVADHPLLLDSGIVVNGKSLPVNDVFRAVHDYFGHAKDGFEFGPRGEYNAYLAHSKMYSKEARPAMAAETMGQNSWVNFGPHLRNEAGEIIKKGEKGYVPASERPFAEQKATILPAELRENFSDPKTVTPADVSNLSGEEFFNVSSAMTKKAMEPGSKTLGPQRFAEQAAATHPDKVAWETGLAKARDEARQIYAEVAAKPDTMAARQKELFGAGQKVQFFSEGLKQLAKTREPGLHSEDLLQPDGTYSPAVDTNKEHIKIAAVKMPDGKIFEGSFHGYARAVAENAGYGPDQLDFSEDGFMTSKGNFVDRDEAKKLAMSAGQIDVAKLRKIESQHGTEQTFKNAISSNYPLEATTFESARAFSPSVPAQVRESLKDASPHVKDELGIPKLFFHGTPDAAGLVKSGKFATEKQKPHSLYGPGFYFTDNPETAGGDGEKSKGYAMTKEGGNSAGVVPAYLDVKNPFEIDKTYENGVDLARSLVITRMPRPKIDPELRSMVDSVLREGKPENRRVADILVDNDPGLEKKLGDDGSLKYGSAHELSVSDVVASYLDWKLHPKIQNELESYISNITTGQEFYERASHLLGKTLLNAALENAGYDGIVHTGGSLTGNDPHKVVVVFRPDKIIGAYGGEARKKSSGSEVFSPAAEKKLANMPGAKADELPDQSGYYWMTRDGKFLSVPYHEQLANALGVGTSDLYNKGLLRVVVRAPDTGIKEVWMNSFQDPPELSPRQKQAVETLKDRDFKVSSGGGSAMSPATERIEQAAIRLPNGKVYTGKYHGDAIEAASKAGEDTKGLRYEDQGLTGFVTNQGKFVTREEALELALKNQQITKPEGSVPTFPGSKPNRLEAFGFNQNRKFSPAQPEMFSKQAVNPMGENPENVKEMDLFYPERELTPTELAASNLARKELKDRIQLLPDVEDKVKLRRAINRGFAEVSDVLSKQTKDESFDSGADWYRKDLGTMEDVTKKLFPETKDETKMNVFKALLAGLSGGARPKENYQYAAEAFAQYLKTGKFPASSAFRVSETGKRKVLGRSGQVTADKLNYLLKKTGGEQQLSDYLLTKHEKTLLGNEDAYGALDLGPKFGRFFLNMTGHADEVTVDLWATRTFNRWMGTPFRQQAGEAELPDTPTDSERNVMIKAFNEIGKQVSEKTGVQLDAMDVQAILWYYEKDLYSALTSTARDSFGQAAKTYAEDPLHKGPRRVIPQLPPRNQVPKEQLELTKVKPREYVKGPFSPGFGYIGQVDLESGSTRLRAGNLHKLDHEKAGMFSGTDTGEPVINFRYNPKNQTVYWWNSPTELAKESAIAAITRKGYKIKDHKSIATADAFAESHGEGLTEGKQSVIEKVRANLNI